MTSGSLTKTFTSDARGNLISITNCQLSIINFQFDNDNNMIGAEVNGTNWTFRYNSQNQMYYSKIVDEYENVIDERFYIYDGLDCIAETETDGTILREYIRKSPFEGGEGGCIGGIVAEVRHNDQTCAQGYQTGTFYYHYNHRGDVIAVSEHNGGIVFKADYDAYGKITRIDNGIFEPRYTFSTKRYFKELGLYYYGYRWYLPELGRWTTKDRIGYKGGTYNLYMFCDNTVVTVVDKYGLSGTLTIHSNSGHSWIEFKHDRNENSARFSTSKDDGFRSGVEVSSYIKDNFNPWSEANRSMHINDEQEKAMNGRIADSALEGDSAWDYLDPCTGFAADVWEAATGEDLQDRFLGISNPITLKNSINEANANDKCK